MTIETIKITSPLSISELTSKGFVVKIDYDVDERHSVHSCLGCIMKDGKSIPFFDTTDDKEYITEIGLLGHDYENLLKEIREVVPFTFV